MITGMLAIEAHGLKKKYNTKQALDDISLAVKQKELFGLIGPDGAGKTTLLRVLNTMLLPDSGEAKIEGHELIKEYKSIREIMGYMPGRFSLYEDLNVEENLTFYATMYGSSIKENQHLIAPIYAHIEPYKKRLVGKLSGGMKQKLALCCALIHRPSIMFLDEPTRGIDPVSRKDLWKMLQELKNENITIIVSTAYMDEADLCDRVALMNEGKILDKDSPENLKKKFTKDLFGIRSSDDTFGLIRSLKAFEHAHSVYPFGDYIHYTDLREKVVVKDLLVYLESHGITDVEVKKIQPSVEDYFIALTAIK